MLKFLAYLILFGAVPYMVITAFRSMSQLDRIKFEKTNSSGVVIFKDYDEAVAHSGKVSWARTKFAFAICLVMVCPLLWGLGHWLEFVDQQNQPKPKAVKQQQQPQKQKSQQPSPPKSAPNQGR